MALKTVRFSSNSVGLMFKYRAINTLERGDMVPSLKGHNGRDRWDRAYRFILVVPAREAEALGITSSHILEAAYSSRED